jgi:flagellar hook-length control protein FliK
MAAADGSAAARAVAAGAGQRSIRPGFHAGQAADDPAMPDDGATETGPDSPATKAAERTAVPAQPPRTGLPEHTPESVRVAPAGAAGADGASMGETRQAPPPETSAACAAAPGATAAVRAGSDSAGGGDPLPTADEAALCLVAGADPALGARAADRPHPAGQAVAHLPPGFGQRLAEAVAHFPDRTIELTLSPEELGRVRMTLATHDGTLTLAIHADRPETIDLMRRHIDQLAQDFRDLGFSDLSFSFGRDDSARHGGSDARQADATAAEPVAPALVPIASTPGRGPRGEPDGGLDLRL